MRTMRTMNNDIGERTKDLSRTKELVIAKTFFRRLRLQEKRVIPRANSGGGMTGQVHVIHTASRMLDLPNPTYLCPSICFLERHQVKIPECDLMRQARFVG